MTDPTRDRLLQAIGHTPSLTRPQLRRRVKLAYGLALALMLGMFAAVGGTAHSATRSPEMTALITLGLVAFAALISGVTARRTSSALGQPSALLAAVLCSTPLVLLGWLSWLQPSQVHAEIPAGFRCLALSIALGGVLLAAMSYARRASDPVHPGWLGGALGATSAVWAATLVAAWCPLYDLPHTLLGHVAPALVLGGAGVGLASRVLRL